jgi:hypothetical protein
MPGWTDDYEELDRWFKEDAYKQQLTGVRVKDWEEGELILHDRKETDVVKRLMRKLVRARVLDYKP